MHESYHITYNKNEQWKESNNNDKCNKCLIPKISYQHNELYRHENQSPSEKWGGKHVDATRGACNPKNLGSRVSQKIYEGHMKKKASWC